MKTDHLRPPSIARYLLPLSVLLLLMVPAAARADTWVLRDWAVNIDGTIYNPDPLPASVDASAFDFATGLGTLTFSVNTAGSHVVGVYLSLYEDAGFGNLTNAYGSLWSTPPAGVTWELGSPGVPYPTNSVFDSFVANTLDDTNHVGAYSAPPNACCDVAMAMNQDFTINDGDTDVWAFTVSPNLLANPTIFNLATTNHDSGDSVYLFQGYEQGTSEVPEPASVALFLTVCTGTFFVARRRRA